MPLNPNAPSVSVVAAELVEGAVVETGLDDFGGDDYREGLDRLCGAIVSELDEVYPTVMSLGFPAHYRRRRRS